MNMRCWSELLTLLCCAVGSCLRLIALAAPHPSVQVGSGEHHELQIGDMVHLHGLQAVQYNGLRGVVESWDAEQERWSVLLDDTNEPRLLKPANLAKVDCNAHEIASNNKSSESAVVELERLSTELAAERSAREEAVSAREAVQSQLQTLKLKSKQIVTRFVQNWR